MRKDLIPHQSNKEGEENYAAEFELFWLNYPLKRNYEEAKAAYVETRKRFSKDFIFLALDNYEKYLLYTKELPIDAVSFLTDPAFHKWSDVKVAIDSRRLNYQRFMNMVRGMADVKKIR